MYTLQMSINKLLRSNAVKTWLLVKEDHLKDIRVILMAPTSYILMRVVVYRGVLLGWMLCLFLLYGFPINN